MRVCKVKIEGKAQPKHDLNLCGIFFLPLVGGKTCYGFANVSHCVLQDLLRAHKKIPNFVLICVYVLCDISYIVVGLKRNYLFAKKIMDSEMRVGPTALLIVSHSHSFSRKIKIRSM